MTVTAPVPTPFRRRLRVMALAVALLVAIAGCGSGEGDQAASGQSDGKPVTGGRLVAALAGDPTTLDVMQNSGALTIYATFGLYEGLFATDKEYKPQPMLAKSVDVSDDNLTYTIKLRDGVTFHDGAPMTSADVLASLTRWQQLSGTGKLVSADVASITAPDESTIVIALTRPRYSLLSDLAYYVQPAVIMPAAIAQAYPDTPLPDDQIVGTGPYQLKEYTKGQRVIVERFDDYQAVDEDFGGFAGKKTAYLDEIEYQFVPAPEQQLNGLRSGQFNWAQSVSSDEYDTLKDDPALNVEVADSGLVSTLLLNHNPNSVFSDLKARQALNMVLDKAAIAQASLGSKELYDPLNGSFVLPQNKAMFSDAGKDVYEAYDPEKAKDLFAEAGVTADRTITIYTTQTYPKYYQIGVVVQAELQKIGLTAELAVYDFPTMISKLTSEPESWDISMTGFSGSVTAPAQVLFLTPTWAGEYSSPKLDELMAAYNASTSAEEAKKSVEQIQQFVWDDLPAISLFPNYNMTVTSANVRNLSLFGNAIFWNCWIA